VTLTLCPDGHITISSSGSGILLLLWWPAALKFRPHGRYLSEVVGTTLGRFLPAYAPGMGRNQSIGDAFTAVWALEHFAYAIARLAVMSRWQLRGPKNGRSKMLRDLGNG
jgi:hypothetical protein